MRLEQGEISGDEFASIEREVLARIREIKWAQAGFSVTSPDVKITGIEADVAEELTRR
jgi:hypothetical protein